ncbi:MAG TPA: enoyl-CoA hydratase [Porticoccaceae bacterium]|nr:enoyl-CoA hydratase [Porticoccaceae bacterium]
MSTVLFEIKNNVALLTLNNPEKRNMLTLDVCRQVADYVAIAESHDEVVALIVTGTGSVFCAGGQLSDIQPDETALNTIYSGFLSIAECKIPTIAAVNGAAVGAGFNMAVACDVRIVTADARFEPRFFSLGLHPGGGNTWMLRQLCNWDTAAGMLLFSHALCGREAVEKGLAWSCVEPSDLVAQAFAFAANIKDVPKSLVVRTKETLRAANSGRQHAEIVEIETREQIRSLQHPYAQQAIAAMAEKIASKSAKT